ncbi:MAG: non-homologous end-joining DNA ligase [Balneolaceae bacterium]|nr:non-homologous end-joining DNA ligase [Balneolaceae bacterium]
MATSMVQVGDRTIEMENLDKVIFPDIGVTQGDLLTYYHRISGVMLPHMKDRPLTLQRFPDGIGEEGFYQKNMPDYFPGWITAARVEVAGQDRTQRQVICNDTATLAYLVDQGVVTVHIWQSRSDKLHYPDRMIFDIDPPDDDFSLVCRAARRLRELLERIELNPYVMTTGSRGLHVAVPLERSQRFDIVRAFAKKVAGRIAKRQPDLFTVEMRKEKREGRLFLDYLRNSYGQNSVAPYAVRALPGAPVATPLDWQELDRDITSRTYTVKNIFRRMGQKKDPWKNIHEHAGSLEKAKNRFDENTA